MLSLICSCATISNMTFFESWKQSRYLGLGLVIEFSKVSLSRAKGMALVNYRTDK